MIVPYTTERRRETGMTNVMLGMWLFIVSEIMLYGALFSAYALLRSSATEWPSGRELLSVPMGATNTIVLLLLASLVWRSRNAKPDRAKAALLLSSGLAVVFVNVIGLEFLHHDAAGQLPHVSTFLALYFTLTGLHLAHVVAGFAANAWAILGARRVSAAMTAGRMHALGLYWIFVAIVWLVIFLLMYLS